MSLKQHLRLWKDMAKCVWLGATAPTALASFDGWSDTLTLGAPGRAGPDIPRIAWLFWDSDEKPALVQATINRVQHLNPDIEVILLDQTTVRNYINASFLDRFDITLSHKSDIVRLELLSAYGGIWLDATCVFNESLSWVYEEFKRSRPDLIAFYRDKETSDHLYPIIESWFLACPPRNAFVQAWRAEFNKVLDLGSVGYFKYISSLDIYPFLKQGITRPEYLVVYLAEQLVVRRINPSLYLRKSEASPFFYQQLVSWDRILMASMLCRMKAPAVTPPVIKLTHSNRYLMPILIKFGLVKRDSIIGRFLQA